MKPKHSHRAALSLAAAAFLFLGACGGSNGGEEAAPAAGGDGATAVLRDFAFDPDPLEIEAGTSVTWTNKDDILHTVTSGIGQKQGVPGVSQDTDAKPDGLFDQKMDGVGSEFEFTFDEPGRYRYYCAIHPGMRGVVVVE